MAAHKPPLFFLRRARTCRDRLLLRVDVRILHDFRTSLRRLEAALRLERPLLGKELFEREREGLRYLRELTNPLREGDVTARILAREGILDRIRELEARQKKEEAFQAVLADPAFGKLFSDLEALFKPGGTPSGFHRGVHKAFRGEMKRLRESLEDYRRKGPHPKVLHRLRIRSKRLRYDLEMFPFLHPAHRKGLLQAANRVQDVLGRLRDLQEAEKGRKGTGLRILRAREKRERAAARKVVRRLRRAVV